MPDKHPPMHPSMQVTTEILQWLSEPELKQTQKLMASWPGLTNQGSVPFRALTGPVLAPFLKQIIIWEPIGPWRDARVRLMGEALTFRFGSDIKGHRMSEVFSHVERPQHIGLLRTAMGRKGPSVIKSSIRCGQLSLMQLELFAAPIRDVGDAGTLALVHVQPYP